MKNNIIVNDWARKARFYNPPIKEKYSRDDDPKEEIAAQVAMRYFVTDPEGSIYAIRPLIPELFAALLKARYSRTALSARQLLWREFVTNKQSLLGDSKENIWDKIEDTQELIDNIFNFKRAEGMAERILLQYGDDSVFELGGAHLFLDRVSMVASKIIEDIRIGLSPLEKSTRYVVFDQKGDDGDYSFFKDPKIMESKYKELYLKTIRSCFRFYTKSVQFFIEHFKKQVPINLQSFPDFSNGSALTPYPQLKDEKSIKSAQIVYMASVRSKACDIARVLLPAATLTNIGEFGNARAYGYLLTKMLSSPMSEVQMIADEALRELKKVLPKFFDVVDNQYGLSYQDYLKKTEQLLQKRAKSLLRGIKAEKIARVELVTVDADPEITIVAALLYPYSNLPLKQLLRLVKKFSKKVVGDLLHDSLKYRSNRRHKPLRAFELPGYELVFDILGNFGIYRDLHRQRMLTQQRQTYTAEFGFDMPLEFVEVGLDRQFVELMQKVKRAYGKIVKEYPSEVQYLITMANYTRWYMGMNLREAFWLVELRSIPQGHFSYRVIAQDMFLKAQKVYPFLKRLKEKKTHYVDMSDRSKNLERMEAMQKIEVKLAQIEAKYSKVP